MEIEQIFLTHEIMRECIIRVAAVKIRHVSLLVVVGGVVEI